MDETDIARLTRERDEARWAATCDVCLGDPLPGTRGCICGGTGKLADTALGLREELARADNRAATAEKERDEARERAASLSRELLTAIRARDSYRASAELRVGMRREFEELLNVGDTTAPETFEAGLVRLRALRAAEAKAERLAKAVRCIRDYEPREAAKDEFAYDRMVGAYRDAARAVLAEVGK